MALLPDNFDEAVADFVQTGLCVVTGAAEGFANLAAGIVPGLGNQTQANILRALRLRVCGDDGPIEDVFPPSVQGGQCPGINYTVVVQQNRADTGEPAPPFTLGTFPGPIREVSPLFPPVNCSNPGLPANNYYRFENGQGNPIYQSNSCSAFLQNPTLICTPNSPEPPGGCGNPPPIPPGTTPAPVTYEGDTIINIDGGTQITIPTAVIFAPISVDLDGSVSVPLNIDLGGINFDGTLELFPDFNLELFPNGLNPGAGSSDDEDELAEPSPGGPTTPPDNPDDPRRIIGVQITAQVPDSAIPTEIAFTNGPAIFAPRLGSCRFLVLVNDFSGWTNDIDIKGTETYIPCPVPQGAIAVRCSPAPGVSLQFTPVRGRVRNG